MRPDTGIHVLPGRTAKVIVITCDKPEDTMKMVQLCQEHFRTSRFCPRAGQGEAHELLTHGVTQFSRENVLPSALELAHKP
ncbi:hypothetical protein ACNKHW_21170 [Shigella flexneri]